MEKASSRTSYGERREVRWVLRWVLYSLVGLTARAASQFPLQPGRPSRSPISSHTKSLSRRGGGADLVLLPRALLLRVWTLLADKQRLHVCHGNLDKQRSCECPLSCFLTHRTTATGRRHPAPHHGVSPLLKVPQSPGKGSHSSCQHEGARAAPQCPFTSPAPLRFSPAPQHQQDLGQTCATRAVPTLKPPEHVTREVGRGLPSSPLPFPLFLLATYFSPSGSRWGATAPLPPRPRSAAPCGWVTGGSTTAYLQQKARGEALSPQLPPHSPGGWRCPLN